MTKAQRQRRRDIMQMTTDYFKKNNIEYKTKLMQVLGHVPPDKELNATPAES